MGVNPSTQPAPSSDQILQGHMSEYGALVPAVRCGAHHHRIMPYASNRSIQDAREDSSSTTRSPLRRMNPPFYRRQCFDSSEKHDRFCRNERRMKTADCVLEPQRTRIRDPHPGNSSLGAETPRPVNKRNKRRGQDARVRISVSSNPEPDMTPQRLTDPEPERVHAVDILRSSWPR